MDLLEIEPKYPPLQSAGAAQPVEKAPGQGGLAAAGLAVDQEGRLGLALHGPLQLLKLPVAPNEAVVPQIRLLGQSRSPFLPLAIRLEAGEAGIALRICRYSTGTTQSWRGSFPVTQLRCGCRYISSRPARTASETLPFSNSFR